MPAKVVNRAHLPHDISSFNSVYIGRPSKWGNPFIEGKDGDRDEVIAKYRQYLQEHPFTKEELQELRGKYLVCWCHPLKCHGDVLAELVNDACYDL